MRTTSETSGTTSNIQIIGVPEEEDKKKDQSRLDAQDRISEVEDRMVEINETERKKEKRIK